MSYLPIILVVLYLLNNKKGKGLDFLGGLDVESITPLLSLFGVNKGTVDLLSSPELKNVLSGNADIKSILPLLTNLLTTIKRNPQQNYKNDDIKEFTPEYLNPIKEIAGSEVLSTLNSYFEQ